jgi:formylglycine-generating enzyme required for sulfatase activity
MDRAGYGERFVPVPAGRFVMGSPISEPYRRDEEVPHEVTITSPFFLGRFEVTQEQWQAVMGAAAGSFKGDRRRPVETVTWFEVQDFLRRLTERSPDSVFRLPTEAEWELACRTGTPTAYHVGASLGPAQARIDPRRPDDATGPPASNGPVPVGSFAPNSWGLHDMHGNVWEWTADPYCSYPAAPAIDPRPSCSGEVKVIRGVVGIFVPTARDAAPATRIDRRTAGSAWGFAW